MRALRHVITHSQSDVNKTTCICLQKDSSSLNEVQGDSKWTQFLFAILPELYVVF